MLLSNPQPHFVLFFLVLSQGLVCVASSIRLPLPRPPYNGGFVPSWSDEYTSTLDSISCNLRLSLDRLPRTLVSLEGSNSSNNAVHSIGVRFRPRTTPILAQAVAGTITQAMWNAYDVYGLLPRAQRNSFSNEFTVRHGPDTFDTVVQILASGSQTGPYVLTNYRMCRVLSLLGYEFSTHINMASLTEYDFDVVIIEWDKAPVVIGRGYMANRNIAPVS